MKVEKERTHNWKWLLTSGGAVVTVFSWELLEEVLENVIALGISSAIAVLSTFLLVCATQGIKLGVKRLIKVLFPLIKQLIYKEGNDKMKLLKNYWTKVWGNRVTGGIAGVGFATTAYFALDTVILKTLPLIITVAVAFIVAYNIAVFFGGETVAQIQARWAEAKLTKEEKAKVKATEAKAKELAKQVTKQSQERLLAQARAIVEQEEKEKAQQVK
jgi:hypothetical protein